MIYYSDDSCKKLFPIWGVLTGIVCFILIYGIKILNPFYVDWLLVGGDLSQHYLGWEFFNRDVWHFPIGLTDQLAYPIETSVLFTDSIPVFAVFGKLFRTFLPKYFQYFGWWGVLCFALQGYFATKIFNTLDIEWFKSAIGNLFLITAPIMLYRMYMHTSLGAQWIILAAIYLFLKQEDVCRQRLKLTLYWGLMGILVSGVHLYFAPMCFLFALGSCIKSFIDDKRIKISYIVPLISYMTGMCLNVYILGGFASKAASGADGFEAYSFNLNGFFNPRDFSKIMPQLNNVADFQSEGFAYLGLGILIAFVVWVVKIAADIIKKEKYILDDRERTTTAILICIGIISFFMAVSPVITLGDKVLVSIPIPWFVEKVWSIFRSTGRFIWIAWYLLVIYCIKAISGIKFGKDKYFLSVAILIICMVIQLFDISEAMISRHRRFSSEITYEYADSDFWESLKAFREFNHLCIAYTDRDLGSYIELGAIALKYDFTINGFYFARDIDGMLDNFNTLEWEYPESDSIYVFLPEQTETLSDLGHLLRYYHIGNFVIGVSWLDDEGIVNDFSYE